MTVRIIACILPSVYSVLNFSTSKKTKKGSKSEEEYQKNRKTAYRVGVPLDIPFFSITVCLLVLELVHRRTIFFFFFCPRTLSSTDLKVPFEEKKNKLKLGLNFTIDRYRK